MSRRIPNTTRAFVKNGWLTLLRAAFAGVLFGIGCVAVCGEPKVPDDPTTVTDPLREDQPKPKLVPDAVPDANGPPTPAAPRPATFTDYLPTSSLFSSPARTAFPIVENKTSQVANQLVRDSSNESIFLQGTGPKPATLDAIPLGNDVPFLHTGPFAFRTSMGIENYFNDNFFGSATNPRSSWLRNYTPGFSMTYNPNAQVSGSAFYSATLHDYSTTVERDYYDESGGASITVRHFGVEGLSFSLSDLYTQIGNTIVNPLASSFDVNNLEFRTGTRYATNSLPVAFKYNAGPLTLEAVYAYDVIDYFGQLHESDDAQQHTGTFRGTYDVSPGHFAIFGESNFMYVRYPSAANRDFDFVNLYTGVRGRFDNLTYQVKTGYCAYDALGRGTITARPVLATEARYEMTSRVDLTVFGTRAIETGLLTEGSKVDSYGAALNIRPMLRGQLTLSHVWQNTTRLSSRSVQQIETTELGYRHRILGWLEPRLGMKYSLQGNGIRGDDKIWTGLAGIGIKIQSRARADVDYYHEDLLGATHRQITDRWSNSFSYRISKMATGTFGLDHAFRRDTNLHSHINLDELRLGINLTW